MVVIRFIFFTVTSILLLRSISVEVYWKKVRERERENKLRHQLVISIAFHHLSITAVQQKTSYRKNAG